MTNYAPLPQSLYPFSALYVKTSTIQYSLERSAGMFKKRKKFEAVFVCALADLVEPDLNVLASANEVPEIQVICPRVKRLKQIEEVEDPHFVGDCNTH